MIITINAENNNIEYLSDYHYYYQQLSLIIVSYRY
jgi:hypothetical protein